MTIPRKSSVAPFLLSALVLLVQCTTSSEQPSGSSATGSVGSNARGGAGGVSTGGSGGRTLGGAGATGARAGSSGGGGSGNPGGAGGTFGTGAGGVAVGFGSGGVAGSAFGSGGVAGAALGSAGGGVGGTASAPELTMSSTAVPTNGAFVDANTCLGADTSPDLEWMPGVSQPQSYAVVLSDAATGVVQWIVWDIPATTTSLPAGLPATAMLATPAGAKQVSTSGNGYVGPCPPNDLLRFYEFTIFALPVATLAGVTTDSPPSAVATAINLTPPIDIAFFGASAGMAPPVATGGVAGSG